MDYAPCAKRWPAALMLPRMQARSGAPHIFMTLACIDGLIIAVAPSLASEIQQGYNVHLASLAVHSDDFDR